MARPLWRISAVLLVLALSVTGCSNSKKDTTSPVTTATGKSGSPAGPRRAAGSGAAERNTFRPISGVPGVSDRAISYAVIGTKVGNPLGTCILDCYRQGIDAYFAFRNSQGGIYGRRLVVGEELDDALAQNQVQALAVISGKKSFGAFEATLLASGWGDLDAAGVPTYTWGIQPADAANRSHIFPSVAVRCDDCTTRVVPYAVKMTGAKRVASIGYGVSDNSKVCTRSVADSIKLYSDDIGASVAYVNDKLAFGLPNGIGPEVTAMKKAGVDFISTCIDLNGMKTLAQELDRQGMQNVTLYHPNSYDQRFIANAGGIFEGDVVSVLFRPFESETAGTALSDFLTWMAKQGDQPTELAMVGWINASLAFEGLLAAGPSFDRAKVTDATNSLSDFSAGGLIQPTDWSVAHTPYTQATRDQDKGAECGALVRVKDGKFVTVAPRDKPWLCWNDPSTKWSEPVPTSFR